MKRYNRYNKFVLNANATVCVYGNKTVRVPFAKSRLRRFMEIIFFSMKFKKLAGR